MNPKTREKRIMLGVCISCGGILDTNGKTCIKCRKKESDTSKQRREWYLKSGLCQSCGREKLYGSEKYCPECRAKRAFESAKQREKDRERYNKLCSESRKRNYLKRKESGFCCRCGKRKSDYGTLCSICYSKRKFYNENKKTRQIPRSERVSYGICYICGSILDRKGSVCTKCAKTITENLPDDRGGGIHWKNENRIVFEKN